MRYLALITLLALLVPPPAAAGDEVDDRSGRPHIGLALGGGGARGGAHVGVLRVLEELGIPIDYVAGTSMGSIVGALFALGLSADQIERELLAVDWGDLFVDRPARHLRPMRRKDDDRDVFFPVEFGLRGLWLATPRGFIAGQKFAFAFPEPGLLVAGHQSFDDLPIPYRAIATDLETGERVVLDRGNLINAVRASMSIPGVFPPVEIGGRLLVDGYLTSNLPVDAVREMGADIVIAVEVSRRLEDTSREELSTWGGIQEQASRIRSQLALAAELSRADIVIQPQLEQWSGQEYDQLELIMTPGEEAARASLDRLRPLSVSPEVYQRWRAQVSAVVYPYPIVNRVKLVNRSRIPDDVIRERLNVALEAPFDREAMRRGVENVYELGLVERSDIDLDRVDGAGVLTVTVHEKPYAPFITYLGGAYRMNDSGRSPFTLRLRVNRLEVNRAGAEWRNDLTLGSVFGLRSEFYQPLDRVHRRWFLAPSLLAAVRNDALFLDNRFIGDYQHRQLLGSLELGRVVGRDLELRAGIMGGHLSTEWASGLIPIPKRNHGVAGVQASLLHDSLDSHRVPQNGLKLDLRFFSPQDVIGSDVAYDRLWGQFLTAASNSRGTLLVDLQGGTDLGSRMPYYAHFYLGGLRHLSGYHVDRNRGSTFGLASVGWLHRLGGGTLPVASRAYLGFWFDTGNTWYDTVSPRLDDLIHSGAVSLLIETPLGPLHLGYGRSDRGHSAFHLDFGIHLGAPVN